MANNLPQLPDGFVIDSGPPALPEGFVLDGEKKTDRSASGALRYGLRNLATGLGQTKDLALGEPIRPNADAGNYSPASPTKGFSEGVWPGVKQTARYAMEMAPTALATLAAAVAGPEGAAVPLAAGTGMLASAGGRVKERAENMGHATPTGGDIAAGLGNSAVTSTLGALPVTRFIPGANPITSTGVKAIGDAALKLGKTVAAESGSMGAQNAAGQVGATAGTPGGVNVDPSQVGDAMLGGAAFGTGMRLPRFAVDAQSGIKYRGVTPENAPAAAAISERLSTAAKGTPDKAALDAVERDIHSEIRQGASGLENLSQDAKNALARPSNLGASELKTLKTELGASPEGEGVMHLVRQAQMADLVRKSGIESGGQLLGGSAAALARAAPILKTPLKAALYAGGSHFIPGVGFLGAPVVGGLFGAYGAARAVDAMTGARNPVARFQKRFEQPGAQVRLAPQTAPAASVAPPGPAVPPIPPVAPQTAFREQIRDVTDQMAARRANAQLLAQLAKKAQAPQAPSEPVAPTVTKVSKANGKTQHTTEAPPPMEAALKETQATFEPKEPSQLPYYGEEHADVADHKLANRPDYQNLSKERKSIIREGIIRGRMADEQGLRSLVYETKSYDEKGAVISLIEELHHTSSRQRAREARDHYASLVSPSIAAKIKAKLTDAFINKSKRKD